MVTEDRQRWRGTNCKGAHGNFSLRWKRSRFNIIVIILPKLPKYKICAFYCMLCISHLKKKMTQWVCNEQNP